MLVSRPGLSPIMVGRDAELAELRRLFRAARGGTQVALVAGEAGVGKSRLLREFADELGGARVLAGHAEEGDDARPFQLLRDAAEEDVAGWDAVPAPLADRDHTLRHVLAPLLPSDGHRDDHEHASDELLHVGVELVRHLLGDQPAVVILEDLHWADAESIELFGRLALLDRPGLLLVGTYRPEDFDRRHPLAGLLPELERQRAARRLSLSRLSRNDLVELLAAIHGNPPSARTVDTLHERTHGNPFFIEELLDTCPNLGADEIATIPLPWNAAEAVLRRVDGLDVEARQVLEAAAVLGARVPFDLLAVLTGQAEGRLIELLRALVDRGLLAEREPDVFVFRHALTREAVAGQLLGRQRRRLHEAAFTALRDTGSSDDSALAAHAAGAGRWDDLVEHARAGAARYLREGSNLQALNLAEQALPHVHDAPAELELLAIATDAAQRLGAADVAESHAERWREVAAAQGDAVAESAALRQLALLRWHAGDEDGQWEHLHAALARVSDLGPGEELAWCLAHHSKAYLTANRLDESLTWAEQALAMAEQVGADRVRSYALVNKGTALLWSPGRETEGLALVERARAEASARNDVVTLSRALHNALAFLVHAGDRPDEAWQLLDHSRATAQRHGLSGFAGKLAVLAAELAWRVGDQARVDDELATARRTVATADKEIDAGVLSAELALEHRDVARAGTELAAARRLASACGEQRAWLVLAEVAVAGAAGDISGVDAALERLTAFVGGRAPYNTMEVATEIVHAAGVHALSSGMPPAAVAERVEQLRAAVEHGRPRDGAMLDLPRHGGRRARYEAALAEAGGDPPGAAAGYQRAIDARPRLRVPELASCHAGLARALAELGDLDAARSSAAEATSLLAGWPGWRRAEAEGLLRRLGGIDGEDPGQLLTPRERQVLALLAEGLTNRQIAERLYISAKTAAVHVSNILGKTGLASRTEAAAWAARSGLAEPEPVRG